MCVFVCVCFWGARGRRALAHDKQIHASEVVAELLTDNRPLLEALTPEQLAFFVNAFVAGLQPRYLQACI